MGVDVYRVNQAVTELVSLRTGRPSLPLIQNPPIASFTFSPAAPGAGQEVTFDATGSEHADQWIWEDVKVSPPIFLGSGETFQFTFQNVGEKHIRLTVTNAVDSASVMQVVTVGEEPAPEVAPTDAPILSVGSPGATSIPLSWTTVEHAVQYEVQHNGVTIATLSGTSYTDSGLDSETEYGPYRVRGINSHGEGQWSNEVSATTVEQGAAIGTTLESSLTVNEITWTFNGTYPCGQYANGDWFVVAPSGLTVEAVDPPFQTVYSSSLDANIDVHGTMVDPEPGRQAYTDVGISNMEDNVEPAPFTVTLSGTTPKSIVSGLAFTETGQSGSYPGLDKSWFGFRPSMWRAAVLTVVAEAPPVGSFRPPYIAGQKLTDFNVSQIDWAKLEAASTLRAVTDGSEPLMTTVESWFGNVFLDHLMEAGSGGGGNARRTQRWIPLVPVRAYGQDVSDYHNAGILRLLMAKNTNAEKEQAVIGAVQRGIDLWANALTGIPFSGPTGGAQGGLVQGRGLPIMFAGWITNRAQMSTGTPSGVNPRFQHAEFNNTYWHVGNDPEVPLSTRPVGTAAWCGAYFRRGGDSNDWFLANDNTWNSGYRTQNTSPAWHSMALALWTMGLVAAVGHDPFFDYCDYFVDVEDRLANNDLQSQWATKFDAWTGWMWRENRYDFGTVPTQE